MKPAVLVLSIAAVLSLGACKKADDAAVADQAPRDDASTAGTETARTGAPSEDADSPAAQARSEQQGKLDYATMEDGYVNAVDGQWASTAKASSADGTANDPETNPDSYGTPSQATGAPNGRFWNLSQGRPGFDWLQVGFDKPVSATEIRIAFEGGDGAQAIHEIALIDSDGALHTVWSGLSDVEDDKRGERTWFVKTFDATPYKVASAKLTIANNVESNYKHIDAVQLIGK